MLKALCILSDSIRSGVVRHAQSSRRNANTSQQQLQTQAGPPRRKGQTPKP